MVENINVIFKIYDGTHLFSTNLGNTWDKNLSDRRAKVRSSLIAVHWNILMACFPASALAFPLPVLAVIPECSLRSVNSHVSPLFTRLWVLPFYISCLRWDAQSQGCPSPAWLDHSLPTWCCLRPVRLSRLITATFFRLLTQEALFCLGIRSLCLKCFSF